MHLVYKPDGPSDGVKTGNKSKQKASHSPSPFVSLKEFGNHLSKAFGLGDSHHRSDLSHLGCGEEELFASFEPHSNQRGKHPHRRKYREKIRDPWNSYGTPYCVPGPSTPRMPIQRQETSSPVADDMEARRPFIEIHEWWLEELNLFVRFINEGLELNFLPEDSPLKGKEVAVWRIKTPEMESERPQHEFPCQNIRRPEKSFQGRAMKPLEEKSRPPVHPKNEIHNTKATDIRLQDGQSNMVLRIEPRLKLRR